MSDMPRMLQLMVLLLFGAAAFCAGAVWTDRPAHVAHEGTTYTCSMHPNVRQPEPGDCPICGMALVPDGGTSRSAPEHVVLSDRARRLAQLRTAVVGYQGDASAEVRLLGRVEPDESTRRNVTTWIGGRIDRLHVNTTGEQVRRGQVIATLYSPEVYGAHQDLITARKQVERLQGGSAPALQAAKDALAAATDRLRLLGVPPRELEAMAEADGPASSVPIRSPFAGTVIERVATEGAYVETGSPLYRLADLGKLWVQLDAYESDLPRIALDQRVSLQVDALPGTTFEGRIAFVDPTVDPQRRTARVRVEVDNPDGGLRPGLFAEATVFTGHAASDDTTLVVPATAPLFTGRRSVVYVEVPTEAGLAYAPRTVRLGPRLGDVYPVVAGLSAGERVVVRGAFALDADLQIRGGPSMMTRADDGDGPFAGVVPLPEAERARLAPVVEAYLKVQQALAEDDLDAARTAATALDVAAAEVELPSAPDPWQPLADDLAAHTRRVATADDLPGARVGFEPLSATVQALLRTFGNPLDRDLHVAFCPMADDDRGASWVQAGETIDNAYFGASMRTCGEIRSEVPPGAFLPSGG